MTIATLTRTAVLTGMLGLAACSAGEPPARLAASSPTPEVSVTPVDPAPPDPARGEPTPGASASTTASASAAPAATSVAPPPGPASTRSPSRADPVGIAGPPGAGATAALEPVRTDLPEGALLPGFDQQQRGVQQWQDLGECLLGTPPQGAATAMATTRTGDGRFEQTVPVQQVAVFGTVQGAVAEAGRLQTQLAGCAGDEFGSQAVAVGAQGQGLSFGYQQASPGRYAFGNYLVTTRRGNAVTLVTALGGEGSPEAAKSAQVARAQQAWARLCVFERTDGC